MSEVGKQRVIIVSMPGTIQESLRAMLEAMPGMEVVGIAGGGLSAIALIQETQPDVIVIDARLAEDEVLALVKDVKRLHPQIRLVVLIHTTRQHRRIVDCGADAVLSRWSSARELTNVVSGGQ